MTWQMFGHRGGDPCNAFNYDGLDRLDYAGYLSDATDYEDFTYDDVGNRESVTTYAGTESYDVDEVTNQYDAVGGEAQTYNAAGQLVADYRGYSYTYDYDGRLTEISDPNGTIAEMTYDALGRRIRFEDVATTTTTDYYYDDRYQVLSDYDGSGTLVQSYVYGNQIDDVLMIVTATTEYYYGHDHLGSIAALVDDLGAVVECYEYDAYGQCTVHTDPGVDLQWLTGDDITAAASAQGNPYTFTGRRQDVVDGTPILQYNRWRYYDWHTGSWTSPDPLGIVPNAWMGNRFAPMGQYSDGVNLFAYAKYQPLLSNDPGGLFTTSPIPHNPMNPYEYPPDPPTKPGIRVIMKGWRWKRCIKEIHVDGHGIDNGDGTFEQERKVDSWDMLIPTQDFPHGNYCCSVTIYLNGCNVGNDEDYMRQVGRALLNRNPGKYVRVCACLNQVTVPYNPIYRIHWEFLASCEDDAWNCIMVDSED